MLCTAWARRLHSKAGERETDLPTAALPVGRRGLLDLGKIRIMPGPPRVTSPLLDVLEVLVAALADGGDQHGWAIMKATRRSGPTVYGVLDRLEDMGWVAGQWEAQNPDPSRPRRRFYQITPTGRIEATKLLLEHRPESLRRRSAALKPGLVPPDWPDALPQGGIA